MYTAYYIKNLYYKLIHLSRLDEREKDIESKVERERVREIDKKRVRH